MTLLIHDAIVLIIEKEEQLRAINPRPPITSPVRRRRPRGQEVGPSISCSVRRRRRGRSRWCGSRVSASRTEAFANSGSKVLPDLIFDRLQLRPALVHDIDFRANVITPEVDIGSESLVAARFEKPGHDK